MLTNDEKQVLLSILMCPEHEENLPVWAKQHIWTRTYRWVSIDKCDPFNNFDKFMTILSHLAENKLAGVFDKYCWITDKGYRQLDLK